MTEKVRILQEKKIWIYICLRPGKIKCKGHENQNASWLKKQTLFIQQLLMKRLSCLERAARHWGYKCDSCPHRAYCIAKVTANLKGAVTVDVWVTVVEQSRDG